MVEAASGDMAQSGTRRILKNVGWLLGGKGFGAVCSIIYLAILARSLGLKDFGHFSVIFATGLTVVELSRFQTWQMVVRFGMPMLEKEDWNGFGRLAMGGGLIDVCGAVLGCGIAWVAIIGFNDVWELNPQYLGVAFAFACALAFARTSAPIGVLRGLDRYDLAVTIGAITPISRLIAAIAIWAVGASVELFLFVWAALELLVAALYWVCARRLAPHALKLSHLGDLRKMMAEHPGILRFLGVTYASTSVWGVVQQGPLLAVGYFLGISAAGVYRIADQLAKGLGKLATLSAQALYPEVNRQIQSSPRREFGRLILRINATVIVAGAVLVGLSLVLGGQILELVGGEDFRQGAPILVPLVLAGSLELASVSYESILHAYGKAHYQLYARLFTLAAMVALIVLLASGGPVWVGWAVAGAMVLGYAMTSAIVWNALRKGTPA